MSKLTAEWCEKEADGFAAIALDVAPEDGGGVEFVMHARALRIAALALRCAECDADANAIMSAGHHGDRGAMEAYQAATSRSYVALAALLAACRGAAG